MTDSSKINSKSNNAVKITIKKNTVAATESTKFGSLFKVERSFWQRLEDFFNKYIGNKEIGKDKFERLTAKLDRDLTETQKEIIINMISIEPTAVIGFLKSLFAEPDSYKTALGKLEKSFERKLEKTLELIDDSNRTLQQHPQLAKILVSGFKESQPQLEWLLKNPKKITDYLATAKQLPENYRDEEAAIYLNSIKLLLERMPLN